MFSPLEIDTAQKFAKSIDPTNLQEISIQTQPIEGEDYYRDSLIPPLKGQAFYECNFWEVPFEGLDASSTLMERCQIENVEIANSNLNSSDFSGSKLHISGLASSFDVSDFSETFIRDSQFEGCSFSESYFQRTIFSNCKFVHSEFISAQFIQAVFENCDFSCSNLAYTEFDRTSFSQTTFPYWGTLHVVRGLPEILSGDKSTFSTPDGQHCVGKTQYMEELLLLRPFFCQKKDYLALANSYILEGENAKAYQAIMYGIEYACTRGNLNLLRHLCRIASLNSFFSRAQMRELYKPIEMALSKTALSPMQYRNYSQELDLARRLLIDSPFNQDTINITIQTSIPCTAYNRISGTLKTIDCLLTAAAPETISHIEIRHNSPIEVIIQIAGSLKDLIVSFATLDRFFDKTSTYVERMQNIIIDHKNLRHGKEDQTKIKQLEDQVAEMKERIQQLECQSAQNNSILALPGSEDYLRISYTLFTKEFFPKELRAYQVSRFL